MNQAPHHDGRRGGLAKVVRVVGVALGVTAIAFLVATLVREWPEVSNALAGASPGGVFVAWLVAFAAMWGLAVLWSGTLHAYGAAPRMVDVSAWYFAGEMGKYLPGGIWPVVGRGELASRSGVTRSVAYGTTMLSLALMVLGGMLLCAVLAPFSLSGDDFPAALWLAYLALPLGLALLHPAVLGRVFDLLRRTTRGRVDLEPASWGRMVGLAAASVPSWLLVGLSSWLVARSLGYEAGLARTMLAATLAWVVGFAAVPVPAGAGIREIVFVATAGLGTTEATVVATVARFLFVLVDAVGGLAGLGWVRAKRILTDESP
ncbi:MAG: flippase-like domain-containing protein [Actinomycetia bacterium]|nr:flippase-like domain-containing protein [Actinomycetes bacterium]